MKKNNVHSIILQIISLDKVKQMKKIPLSCIIMLNYSYMDKVILLFDLLMVCNLGCGFYFLSPPHCV